MSRLGLIPTHRSEGVIQTHFPKASPMAHLEITISGTFGPRRESEQASYGEVRQAGLDDHQACGWAPPITRVAWRGG